MSHSLNVIALISGGKDSLFSLLHCIANGHNVIALANLYPPAPPNGETDGDINSFMYQTVGHDLIPLQSHALGLPIYRQEIIGSAINTQKEYHVTSTGDDVDKSDETESMYTLLSRVKAAHSSANAVCSGAILSTYQRTRVESVALRLGLTPLSYLWQYPSLHTHDLRKADLLEDMAAVGLDARIIKVASHGLNEDLLWKNVCETTTQRQLQKAMGRFGGSILGEGGEYETFVVDGPVDVWKSRLNIGTNARKIVRDDTGVFYLTLNGGDLEQKIPDSGEVTWVKKLEVPNLWDPLFSRIVQRLSDETGEREGNHRSQQDRQVEVNINEHVGQFVYRGNRTFRVCNMTAATSDTDAASQMASIGKSLISILQASNHSVNEIAFVTLLLRSMKDFPAINQIYATLFEAKPNPPARVTIACGHALPLYSKVMASFVVEPRFAALRSGLHVQSRSYWAPANIGPYSQAISVPLTDSQEGNLVYVAGQIPLVPSSMDLAKCDEANFHDKEIAYFKNQASLGLQHVWRIGQAMRVCWWTGAIAFIATSDKNMDQKVAAASLAWKMAHEEPSLSGAIPDEKENFDVWDQMQLGPKAIIEEHRLPDFECISETEHATQRCPGFFAVEVQELPRGCMIEWQALGVADSQVKLTSTASKLAENHDISDEANKDRTKEDTVLICSMASGSRVTAHIGIFSNGSEILEFLSSKWVKESHITMYSSHVPSTLTSLEAQIIPCKSVWSAEGEMLAAGIVIEHDSDNSNQKTGDLID